MATLLSFPIVLSIVLTVLGFWAFFFLLGGLRVIGENESGLVIKRFGRALPPGRLIALDGEAGYQARLLPPGWHLGLLALALPGQARPDDGRAAGRDRPGGGRGRRRHPARADPRPRGGL